MKDKEYLGKIHVITGYAYDVLGNRVQEVDPRAYGYMVDDRENRELYTIRYTYDALNRLDKVIHNVNGNDVYKQYSYDEVGNRTGERNERGYVNRYTYDKLNRVETVTDPEDLAGNKRSETNAKNDSMTYGYKLNRLVTVTDPYNTVVDKNLYDANGNIVKKIDAQGYRSGSTDGTRYGWLYTYDLANRLVKTVDPKIAAQKKPEKFTTLYQYNPVGEKVKESDALGHSKSYEYDNAGRLVKVTDQLDVSVAYSYDMAGNKLDMTDGKGKVTRYRYGAFGLLKEVINAANKSMSYRYDLALNAAEITDRNGNHTRYEYDNRNLLLDRTVAETGDSIQYTYDEAGNRASMTDESGVSSYSYDRNNRLKQIAKDGTTQISYTYDSIGNIETVTDKTGFATAYMYDKSSRMETVAFKGKTTTYSYDENGNRTSITYDGGVKEDYTFDKNNRLLTLTNKKPSGSIISEYAYTYDDAGRQTTKTDSYGTTNYTYDFAGRIEKVEAPGKTTAYAYDRNGNRQTLNETYTSEQPSGYVDPISNAEVKYLVKKSEYMYSGANELQQLVEKMLDAAGKEVLEKTTSYLYDGNGNEIRQKVSYLRPHNRDMRQVTGGNPYGDEITDDISSLIEKVSNTFDGFNRLKQVERVKTGERVTVEYTYDGDDLRTRKTVRSSKDDYAPKITNYLYDRQYVILETDTSDNVAVRYVRGINYIARIDGADKLSYYLFNGHGDVVQTITESGEVENQYDYDIFGNPTLTVEKYTNSIRYAGEFFDEEVGLYYLRARYYDPYIGRFISQDSYWGEDNNPLSLNLYTYGNNNPIMFVDPTGHSASTIQTVIDQINYQKEIFEKEEKKKAPGTTEMTETQKMVHEHADELRAELARLEKGNEQVAKIVDAKGNDEAGDWETYQKDEAEREIDNKIKNGESVSSEEVYNYQKLNAAITVAKDLGRDVVASDNWRVDMQLSSDLGLDNPVKIASVSDYIDPDTVEAAKFATHFGIGVWHGIRNNVAATWKMIKNYEESGKAIGELGKAFLKSYDTHDPTYMLPVYVAIGQEIEGGIERWQEGDRYERAEQVGEYVGGGLAAVVGSKGLSVALKQISIASKITKGLAETAEVTELIDGVDSYGLKAQIKDIAESKGQGLGSALDHVYTATRSLDDEFPELKGVNPYYVEDASPGVNTNCVSCANATDARLTGDNPYATASSSNGYGTEHDLAPTAPWGFDRNLSLNQVKELMEDAGDGQSRVLIIKQGNVDHVINTVNKNGQIYFIDSQIGKIVEPSPNLVYELGRK